MPPLLAQLILATPLSATEPSSAQLSQLGIDSLSGENGLNTALDLFQSYIDQHRERLCAGIDRAMEVKGLLEWLVSRISKRSFTTLQYHILKEFPEGSVEVFLASQSRQILADLDAFFAYVTLPYDPPNTRLAEQNRARLSTLMPMLEALEHCCVDGTDTRAAIRESVSFVSSTPFDQAGVDVPETLADAWKLSKRSLNTLKQIMRTYLTLLREGSFAETIRAAIHYSLSQHQASIEARATTLVPSPDTAIEPPLAHKKAIIVLDTLEGFGPYKITVSSRMIHHMRGSRSRPRLFAQINRKLRELSHGQMEGENGMLLTSIGARKEVFAAQIFSFCAIAYYLPNRPHIRVFGIYQAASLKDITFWNGVGEELSIKEQQGSMQNTETASSPKDPALQERIRALLTLSKCVELSAPVMQSIMDDEEVQVAFELSPEEQEIVFNEGPCYVLGRSGTGKTTVMIRKMLGIESVWSLFTNGAVLKPRQLFVTRSQHLADKVKESFTRLYEAHVVGQTHQTPEEGRLEVSEGQWITDLPGRFGELQHGHFPLFISFDHLCTMLERELGLINNVPFTKKTSLTYEIFLARYWNEFPAATTKGLDPFQVFGEFVGVIKGSESTIGTPKGYLDRSTYMNLSSRTFRTFARQRENVYHLFERYLQQQRKLKQTDIADRTHAILRAFREALPSWLESIDVLYVDEAQDNILIDTLLLRLLCKNSDGLFWAGDTAQTIFAGNSFTFNELRSFFHRVEEKQGKKESIVEPRFFKLATNFRSQAGIVLCGQGILHLIGRIWPTSIDQLPKEMNMQAGVRPLFFRDDQIDIDNLSLSSSKTIEFGAEQCILVRDDTVRQKLAPRLHHSTLILTLYESKGLEFNDVLIFDFFEDSHCTAAHWSSLNDLVSAGSNSPLSVDRVHDGLLPELKCLYVAVTRARLRLWIVDSSEKASAIHLFWASRNEIETPNHNFDISEFAIASDSAAWERRGRELFSEKRYRLACQAFRMGGNHYEAQICQAFDLQEQVDLASPADRRHASRAAAERFVVVASDACQRQDTRTRGLFENAAGCYLQIPDVRRASQALVDGRIFDRALRLLRDAALFDEAVELVLNHRGNLDAQLTDLVLYESRLFYAREPDAAKTIALFDTHSDALQFVETHGLIRARGKILQQCGQYSALAELYLRRNNPGQALRYYRLASEHEQQPKVIESQLLLEALWKEPSFSYHPDCATAALPERAQSLLHLIALWDQQKDWGLEHNVTTDDLEIDLFEIISFGEGNDLVNRHRVFSSVVPPRRAAAFLALSHYLRPHRAPPIKSKLQASIVWLKHFLVFVRMLRTMLSTNNLANNVDIQRLLGFRPLTTNQFRVLPGSAAKLMLDAHEDLRLRPSSAGDKVVEKVHLEKTLHASLSHQLVAKVTEIVRKYRAAVPSMTRPRAAVHLVSLLILVYDTVRNIETGSLRAERRRLLVEMLYGVLMEVFVQFGQSAVSTIAEATPGLSAAVLTTAMWTSDYFRTAATLMPEEAPRRLLSLVYKATAVYSMLDKKTSLLYSEMSFQGNYGYAQPGPIHDLTSLLSGSLPCGVQLFTKIVEERAAVDSSFICDLVDVLIGGFSLAAWSRANSGGLSAHFPSSCSPFITQNITPWLQNDCRSLAVFLSGMMTLIKRVSRVDHEYFFAAETLIEQHSPHQREMVGRLLNGLVILDMNFRDDDFHQRIIGILRPLRNTGVRVHGPAYLSITTTETWAQLAGISWHPTIGFTIRAEKKIVEKQVGVEILELIIGKDTAVCPTLETPSSLNLEDVYRSSLSLNDIGELCGGCRIREASQVQHLAERNLTAIVRIQRFLRAAHARRQRVPTPPLAHLRQRAFQKCSDELEEYPQITASARRVVLGVLPHALACISALKLAFGVTKDIRSRELHQVGHAGLDEAGKKVVEVNDILVQLEGFESALQPSLGLFNDDNWQKELRHQLREVESMVEKMPSGVERRDIEEEWEPVRTWI